MRSAVLFAVFTAIFSSVAVIATPMQITQDELLARSIPSALDIDPIKRAINAPLTNGERLARGLPPASPASFIKRTFNSLVARRVPATIAGTPVKVVRGVESSVPRRRRSTHHEHAPVEA